MTDDDYEDITGSSMKKSLFFWPLVIDRKTVRKF